MSDDRLDFDVVIVGAGPAGLSAAVRLAQKKPDLSIAVLEKGAQVGAHILSGAVFNPTVLDDLIPDWSEKGAPLSQAVASEAFYYYGKRFRLRLPMIPAQRNHGHFIISLGEMCAWLATQAESLGVSIFPGFPVADVRYNDDRSAVIGVVTAEMGVDRLGAHLGTYQAGVEIDARHVLIAEGACGSVARKVIKQFGLDAKSSPQHYGIGIKEKWRIKSVNHRPGHVEHSIGWPIDGNTYGGGFIYHAAHGELLLGLIVGLHSPNARMNPHQMLQDWKTHAGVSQLLDGGECIGYGARAITEGGYQSIPNCVFPGGSLIGCAAGFVNVAESKGIHHAMRTGILAADAYLEGKSADLTNRIKHSETGRGLYRARNLYPAFGVGRVFGVLYSAVDQWIFRGHAPWTLSTQKPDHLCIKHDAAPRIKIPIASQSPKMALMDSVALTHTHHRENQPSHLSLLKPDLAMASNYPRFGGPEQYYCPAGVYEYTKIDDQLRFVINAQNCIHCKSCVIRDPNQNIEWQVPEGGDGPNYVHM